MSQIQHLQAVLFCLLSFVYVTRSIAENPANGRIIGGTPVDISSVPYLVNIRVNGVFICGGSLVTPRNVVTAAHCARGNRAKSMIVTGGATTLNEAGIKCAVEKVFTPSAYKANSYHSDVAVLRLATPMTGANIATIPLCTNTMQVSEYIIVTGWGVTRETSQTPSSQLRQARIPLIAKSKCVQQYRNNVRLTSTMFCATSPGKLDSCSGDSGGPAVYNGQLCGIVSWGIGCGRPNFPGVYTKVEAVKAFIEKALNS